MNPTNDAQLKIRLSTELKSKIDQSAHQFNRSLNADIVARLNNSFILSDQSVTKNRAEESEEDLDYADIDRKKEVAIRLQKAVQIINNINLNPRTLKYSHIALDNGFESAEGVLEWFQAKSEPTFDELRKLANYFGVQEEWLIHGDLTPIPVIRWDFSKDIEQDIRDLMTIDSKEIDQLLFIRDDSKEGHLSIVKIYDTWKAVVLQTGYHISTVVGDGGRAQLRYMTQLWRQLYRQHLVKTKGYLVAEQKFIEINHGQQHPLSILDRLPTSIWWEAIWDMDDATKIAPDIISLWKDWLATCEIATIKE